MGDGEKQWGNSTINCEPFLLDEKIKYPKLMHCLEYYNDGDYDDDDDDNDGMIFIYGSWVSIRWQ